MPKAIETASKMQIHTGVHITRRKQMNMVVNPKGITLWSGASIFKACRWCLDNGHYSVTMHNDGETIRVMLAEPLD